MLIYFITKTRHRKYSWEDFSKKFRNQVGEIKIYNHKQLDEEQNFGTTKIKSKYKNIFDNKNGLPKMVKIAEDNCNQEEMKLIDYCRPLSHGYKKYGGLTLRIQTSPWLYNSHFDAMDQVVITLHGHKRWLFFYLDEQCQTTEEENKYMKMLAGKTIDEAVNEVLKPNNIKYTIKDTKNGDYIDIPKGLYHLTESNEKDGCIILNIKTSEEEPELTKKFYQLWPNWFVTGTE